MSFKFYTLRQEQCISRSIEEVFAFCADARNLEDIIPPCLSFKILSMSSSSISEGTEMSYQLRLHAIPFSWRTEISRWNLPYRFVDMQRSGPYRLWHHVHIFEARSDRTRMIDVVRYMLPLGFLGQIAHVLKLRSDLQRIFDYWRQRIHEVFVISRGRVA